MTVSTGLRIRRLARDDAAAVGAIDAAHTGEDKAGWWEDLVRRHVRRGATPARIGLVAEQAGELVGYLFGQIRAFEFGSEPCGWIFAIGVHPDRLREGVASALLAEARRRFAAGGVRLVRTMVRRDDVPVLTFFRSHGFAGGPYVELELALDEEAR